MKIRIDQPTGMVPRLNAERLPANAAQYALDCNFNGGSVMGVRTPDTYGGYTHSAPPRGVIPVRTTAGENRLYVFGYDVDGAASPIPDDQHQRFYWTGKNGSATEFKFALAGENGTGNYVGGVGTSYKVGVINSTLWDNQPGSIGITFTTTPKGPPVNFAAIATVKLAGWLADEDGNLVRELATPSEVTSFVGNGTPVNGWYSNYTATLAQDIDSYGQAVVSSGADSGTYRQVDSQVRIPELGSGDWTATLWEVASTSQTKFINLRVRTSLAVGTACTAYRFNGLNQDNGYARDETFLGTFYVVSESVLAYSAAAALPSQLQPVAGDNTALPDKLYFAMVWDFTYNGQIYHVAFHEDKLLSDKIDIGSGIYGSIVRLSDTSFRLTLEFGADESTEVRSYLFTVVNNLGEESEPSLPVEVTLNPGREQITLSIDLTLFDTAVAWAGMMSGRYPGHGIRVYRTGTSSSGNAEFLYAFTVKNPSLPSLAGDVYLTQSVVSTTMTVIDTVPAAGLGSACPTQDYIYDAAELQGLQSLISINAGMFAAAKKNEVWISEPGKPWAWKGKNIHALPHPIVDLVPLEQGFVALTTGAPWYFSGQLPEQMMPQRIPTELPCINKRAVAVLGQGVVYISPDGPVHLVGMQAELDPAFSREQWRDDYGVLATGGKMQLAAFGHRVLAYYPGSANGWLYDAEDKAWTRVSTRIDYALQLPAGMLGAAHDVLLFADTSNSLKRFAYTTTTAAWQWHSKTFDTSKPMCFGALMAFGTGTVIIKMYADGTLKYTTPALTLTTAGVTARLPAGYMATKWSFRIEAQASGAEMTLLEIAEAMHEFKAAT